MMNKKYTVQYETGAQFTERFRSDRAVKMEATRRSCFGCGDITIFEADSMVPLFKKESWQNGNNFGWENWKEVN